MKPINAIIMLVAVGFMSCGPDEMPLTPELVLEIHTYDLDNNGNSSDIRLDFIVENNLNVVEYRIMIIPSAISHSFDLEIAAAVPLTNYLEILPQSFQDDYFIKRLPAGLLDVRGGQIQNGIEYVAAVFVIGEDEKQLSELFLPFTLKDWGIYSGRYWIGEVLDCEWIDLEDEVDVAPDGRFFIDLVSSDGIEYTGIYEIDGGSNGVQNNGRIFLSVEGSIVSDYLRKDASTICISTTYAMLNGETCTLGDSCSIDEQRAEGAVGSITDELILEIEIKRNDCVRTCTGNKILVRQG